MSKRSPRVMRGNMGLSLALAEGRAGTPQTPPDAHVDAQIRADFEKSGLWHQLALRGLQTLTPAGTIDTGGRGAGGGLGGPKSSAPHDQESAQKPEDGCNAIGSVGCHT
jgi:hypothetical protein